jgi:hypothetical protein
MVKALLLAWLTSLLLGCTPHEVRCDGRLEPINASAATPGAALVGRGAAVLAANTLTSPRPASAQHEMVPAPWRDN